MSDIDGGQEAPSRVGKTLEIVLGTEHGARVLRALASDRRVEILNLLQTRTMNVSEIADSLEATMSATSEHIKLLSDAGLIVTEMIPGTRGMQKACGRAVDAVLVSLPESASTSSRLIEVSMPVGAFTAFRVEPTCGLLGADGAIGLFDDVGAFYEPERINAQLLWFHQGYVEYRFPNRLVAGEAVLSLQLSMEICSEAPLHNEVWPSDIVVSVNGIALGSWTSPGDFGNQRGAFTPEWWSVANTQFGLMKVWRVTEAGSFIDGMKLSDVTPADLGLGDDKYISVRIEVPADTTNVGGVNLFGAGFGNYPQDLVMRIQCKGQPDRHP